MVDQFDKISACLVVYNEALSIRRCLESLRGAVDEIIVVHDGPCQDETLNICREFGARIFIRPHFGIMEAHLIFAIRQTQFAWIIRIDADECLSEQLRTNLRSLVADAHKLDISAYSFLWSDRGFGNVIKYKPVLFRKKNLFWFPIPHLVWQTRGRVAQSDYVLDHLQRDYQSAEYWISQKKRSRIQAQYILKTYQEMDNFQANEDDLRRVYSFSRRHAGLILIPVLKFIKSFLENVPDGASLLASWRQGRYNFYLGRDLYCLYHHTDDFLSGSVLKIIRYPYKMLNRFKK